MLYGQHLIIRYWVQSENFEIFFMTIILQVWLYNYNKENKDHFDSFPLPVQICGHQFYPSNLRKGRHEGIGFILSFWRYNLTFKFINLFEYIYSFKTNIIYKISFCIFLCYDLICMQNVYSEKPTQYAWSLNQ